MDQHVDCCIAGGGPAGLMLGVLLARAGVKVAVLEKHEDFLRDFRGDTIHPSTMQVLAELGWLDDFLKLPHQPVADLKTTFGDETVKVADFRHLRVAAPFIAMMPQWDFLNFLARKGAGFPTFQLHMQTKATGLIESDGRIIGVMAEGPNGKETFHARLVVAADGRTSTVRQCANMKSEDIGAPMDVLWFRLPRQPTDTDQTQGRFIAGRIFIMLNRGDYWQCAFVIPKGENQKVRAAGLDAFQKSVGELVPFEAARAKLITDFDDVKLLSVQIDRLKKWWRPGLLCIGDAAHAMSPVGGVGINLAIQDAVATANALAVPLRNGKLTDAHLAAVQDRREWPTRMTQNLQVTMQNAIIVPALKQTPMKPPLFVRLISRFPFLARIPARLIGLGFRPEHIRI